MKVKACICAAVLLPAVVQAGTVSYTYDSRQRLTGGTCNGNISIAYQYDRANNLTRHSVVADANTNTIPDAWELWYFGNLTTATTNSDSDSDGFSDAIEYVTNTNPTNSHSCLQFTYSAKAASGSGFTVRWPSESNRLYRVERSTNLATAFFSAIQTQIPGTPPENMFMDTNVTNAVSQFYRVEME